MANRQRVYIPAGKTVEHFHADDKSFIRGLIGPVGSSSTSSSIVEMLRRIQKQAPSPIDGKRYSRWLLTRSSFALLRTTILNSYRDWIGGEAAGRIVTGDSPIIHRLQFGDVEAEVLFAPCQDDADVERLLSLELTGAILHEWTGAPESILRMMQARVGRFPGIIHGGATWAGIIVEGHQPEPDSWQARMMDRSTPGVRFYVQPPAMTKNERGAWVTNPGADNLKNLPSGYYSKAALDQSDEWIARFCGNERVFIATGHAVFKDLYHDRLHVLPEEYEPEPRIPLTIGLDPDLYGSALLLQHMPGGRVVVVDEIFNREAGITGLGTALVELMARRYPDNVVLRGWTDPSAGFRGVDKKTAIELLRLATPWRWDVAPIPKNDTITRIECIRYVLKTLGDGGKPLLQVSPRAKTLRAALGGQYRFKIIHSGGSDIVSSEVVKDEHASIAESLAYGLAGGGVAATIQGRMNRRRQQIVRSGGMVFRVERNN
jgi:hypothetical protein